MTNPEQTLSSIDGDRRQPRTHLFVAATLYSNAGSVPVHLRNMSPSGALIESPDIPEIGSAVVLKRGGLQTAGKVVWKVDRKGGVAFSAKIAVSEWMARQASGQDRVDQIISDFRSNAHGVLGSPADPEIMSGSGSVVAELLTIRSNLVQLSESLGEDSTLMATHPDIQFLDICLQRLDRLIGQIDGAGL